ncbi:MAG TPA: sortase [Candidatus Scatovivens faecipullorum]|jgi:sortase family protein|nr:sortase [Candidatus Scatovivens faecipullorum]
MNQILVSEKLYITPELKRKKRMYKIDFFISIFLVCILFSYYIYAEYDKNKNEAISKEILSNMSFKDKLADDTTIKFEDNSIVVILNTEDPFYVNYSEPVEDENTEDNIEWFETERGTRYYTIARINIPSIDCDYPILNMIDPTEEQMEEVLKISPVKFWGADPNEVGNFCIVGHNYRSNKFFSNVPDLSIGAEIEITDLSGRTLVYKVYDKYVVDPDDTDCTSQKTNGLKEITVITCTDDSKQRVIVKARLEE